MITPTFESLMNNLELKTFDGHVSIAQFSRGLRESRDRFVSRLLEEDLVPGSPFALELALVRAYHLAHNWANCSVEEFVGRLRLGVYTPHMGTIQEVKYEAMAKAFGYVMMRRDVNRVTVYEDRGRGRLAEWPSIPFLQVDPSAGDHKGDFPSDLLPVLFEMGSSDYSKPALVMNVGEGLPEDGLQESRRKSPVPLMAGKTWNRGLLDQLRAIHPAVHAVGFGSKGAALTLSVLEPGSGARFAKAEKPMLLTAYTLPGPSSEPRPVGGNDLWILAEYTPPTHHLIDPGDFR